MGRIHHNLSEWASTSEAERLVFPAENRRLSLSALLSEMAQVRAFLHDAGLRPGDRLAVRSGNSSAMVSLLLGSLSMGLVWMPLNPSLQLEEQAQLLAHAKAKLLLSDEAGSSEIPARWPAQPITAYRQMQGEVPPSQSEGSVLIYTSGTTGKPKGVLLRESMLLANIRAVQEFLHRSPRSVTACILPLFHLFGVASDLLGTLLHGGKVVIFPEFSVATVPRFAQGLVAEGVNGFSAVPLIYELLVRLGADIPKGQLQRCVAGGAALQPELQDAFEQRFGAVLLPAYGVTEASCYCLCTLPEDRHGGSVGHAVGMDIRLVDGQLQEVNPGEVGEILIHGESVIRQGYYEDDRICQVELEGKIYFRTGDLARQDENGKYYISGRMRNMVIKGGTKIYLEDIDQFWSRLPELAESVSIRQEEKLGEAIEGFVSYLVLKDSAAKGDTAYFKQRIRAALGPDKVPDDIVFLTSLDRTPTGKVKTQDLRPRAAKP